jgi:hypothetical protein
VERRYGESEAYRESLKRTEGYGAQDWERIMGEGDEIFRSLAGLMDKDPEAPQIQALVGAYRDYITRSFYSCTMEIFEGLGQLYVTDPEFQANIDKHKKGLAEFLSQAIALYCS